MGGWLRRRIAATAAAAVTAVAWSTLPALAEEGEAPEALAAAPPPEDGGTGKADPDGYPLHGFVSTRYRLRATEDGDRDQDVYVLGSLDVGDPWKDRVTFHALARGALDIDGRTDSEGFFVFDSISDALTDDLDARLYDAYLDVHRIKHVSVVRLGRQTIYDTPEFAYFDGGRVESAEFRDLLGLQVGVYGGLPVHHYESSSRGDYLAGAFVQVRPWTGGRVRADYMRVQDDRRDGDFGDDLFGLSAWQSVTEYVQLHAAYTRLETRDRDVQFRVTFYEPEWDLQLQASYYQLLARQTQYSIEFDPFYSALFELDRYWQLSLLLYKGLGEHFAVDVGLDLRELIDTSDEGPFNHEFRRYFGTFQVMDLPVKHLTLSVTGEGWEGSEGSGSQDHIYSVYGDAAYQWCKEFRTQVGSSYAHYKYDYFLDSERTDVRTYYAKLRFDPWDFLRVGLEYQYEEDDLAHYHMVATELRLMF